MIFFLSRPEESPYVVDQVCMHLTTHKVLKQYVLFMLEYTTPVQVMIPLNNEVTVKCSVIRDQKCSAYAIKVTVSVLSARGTVSVCLSLWYKLQQ